MALTGKLEADFDDFDDACTKSEAKLGSFQAAAGRTELTLVKMTKGASAGTAPVNDLRTAFQQFDGALAAVGVNLGPQVRGIEDLATAAKSGGEGMGLLAKAGLAFGAGMAAYGITRAALEFAGLNTAIDKAAERWFRWDLGLGDPKAAAAAAAIDVLAKASRIAGIEVTSLSQAVKINEDAQQKWAAHFEAPVKLALFEASLKKAADEESHLTRVQEDLIVSALAVGESNAAIAAGMTLTVGAVDKYVMALKARQAAEKAAAVDAEQLAKLDAKSVLETAELWRKVAVEKIAQSGTETAAKIADIARWRDDETAKLKSSTADYAAHKDAILAYSKQQAEAQMVDWDFLRSHSIEGLQEIADQARATYDEMLFGSRTFTRDELERQLQKTRETADAATAMGQAYTAGLDAAATRVDVLLTQFQRLQQASDDAWAATKGKQAEGGSQDLTDKNVFELAKFQGIDPRRVKALMDQGYSPADALAIARGASKDSFTPKGGAGKKATAPGGGGLGSGGSLGGDGAIVIQQTINVNGVFDLAAQKQLKAAVDASTIGALKRTRKYGARG